MNNTANSNPVQKRFAVAHVADFSSVASLVSRTYKTLTAAKKAEARELARLGRKYFALAFRVHIVEVLFDVEFNHVIRVTL